MNTADIPAPFDQPVSASVEAYAALKLPRVAKRQGEIRDICIAAQRNGCNDLTRKEIELRYNFLYGGHIGEGTVSSSVNGLVTAGRLVEGPKRLCSVSKSGIKVGTVYVPMKQVRLVA